MVQKRLLIPVVVVSALFLVVTGAVAGLLIGGDGAGGEDRSRDGDAKGYLGLSVSSAGRELRVADVEARGPAAAAGIQSGDILRALDGQVVRTPEQLRSAIEAKRPGERVTVTYERGEKELRAAVTLAEAPASARIEAPVAPPPAGGPNDPRAALQNRGRLGVELQPVTPALKQRLNLSRDSGLVVIDVTPGSLGAAMGLQPRDVIVGFAGRAVATPQELQQAVAAAPPNQPLDLTIVRGVQEMKLTATLPPAASIPGIENLPPALRERLQQALALGGLTPQQIEQLQRIYASASDSVRTGAVKEVSATTLVLAQFDGSEVTMALTPQSEANRGRERIPPSELRTGETVIVFSRDGGKTAFGILGFGVLPIP